MIDQTKVGQPYPKVNDYNLTYAFTFKGKDYYQFPDWTDIPIGRAQVANVMWKEAEMKGEIDWFQIKLQEQVEWLNKGNLVEAVKINLFLRDRMDWLFEPTTIINLASLYFVDEVEELGSYNFEYNRTHKIAVWRADMTTELDFFSVRPIRSLLPEVNLSEEDLKTSLTATLQLYRKISENQLRTTDESCKASLTDSQRRYIEWEMEMLGRFNDLNPYGNMNITSIANLKAMSNQIENNLNHGK
jgi:hypothetical protein